MKKELSNCDIRINPTKHPTHPFRLFSSLPPTAFTPESVRRRVAGMKQILLMIAVVALVG